MWLERSEHTVSVQYSINVVSSSKDLVLNVKLVICILKCIQKFANKQLGLIVGISVCRIRGLSQREFWMSTLKFIPCAATSSFSDDLKGCQHLC